MIKELLTVEEANSLTTPALLEYKRELDAYRTVLLDHVYSYMAHYRNVRWELQERKQDLELEVMFLEEDRLEEIGSILFKPDSIN